MSGVWNVHNDDKPTAQQLVDHFISRQSDASRNDTRSHQNVRQKNRRGMGRLPEKLLRDFAASFPSDLRSAVCWTTSCGLPDDAMRGLSQTSAAASKVHVVNGVTTRGIQPFAVSAGLVCTIVSAILRSLESGTVPWQSTNRIARRREWRSPPEFDLIFPKFLVLWTRVSFLD